MIYLRDLGNLLLRMSTKHAKKGTSYLDLTLKEMFEGNEEKGIDGLVGELQELHAEIIQQFVTGGPMTPEEVDKAIDEANDVSIWGLLLANWLRAHKAEWAKQIAEGDLTGFCPIHKRRLQYESLLIAGSTETEKRLVCLECLKNEGFT